MPGDVVQTECQTLTLYSVQSYAEASRRDDRDGMAFANFLARNGIETGRLVPKTVLDLLQAAFNEAPAYVPFGRPFAEHGDEQDAFVARRAKCLDAARGMMAIHDVRYPEL